MEKTNQSANVDEWLDALDPVTTPLRDGRYLRAITAARKSLEAAESDLQRAVAEAREAGDSWTMIGLALGTSKQNAHRKFSTKVH
jgi:hypothetical protein